VKIASGFDASGPAKQGRNADELVALTKRGMPPLEAIRAATLNAAELMGWQDRVGAIEAGKYAYRRRDKREKKSGSSVFVESGYSMTSGTVQNARVESALATIAIFGFH